MAITCPTCRAENPVDSRQCVKCGSAIDLTSSPTMTYTTAHEAAASEALRYDPGEKFGERYTIIEEIGHGGMGRVYKAKDHELGTTVVLKMIRPELTSRPGMIDQFRKETLFGRSITHENVVRIHDLGEIDKVRYISMDFIKGENLGELIQTSGSLALSTCLHIAIQICQALKAAHQKGIVHQDLKPQNVMIDNSGKVFITDFGLARSLATSGPHRPGQISGTPKYFSPEQARGEESDPRSDIYSLGVILYEMATGEAPFKADGAEGYIKKHTSGSPAAPSKLNPGLPSSCERIILKCLEKKREDRYQSADELLGDLKAHWPSAQGPGIAAKRAGLRKLLVAALSILVTAAIVWWVIIPLIWPPRPDRQPLIAVMYAVNNSGDKDLGDQLRWFVPHYLSEFLYQSRYLRVLRQDRLMSILSDLNKLDDERPLSKTLDRISEAANVGYFILPSCAKVGDSLLISTSVIKAKTDVALGEPDTAKGNPDQDLLAMVEELSQKVKSKLDLSPEEIAADAGRGRITSTSPEALRHYTDGERAYARGDYVSSLKALELAVREDPNFAMAYLKMADSYEYVGDYAKHRSYLQKAQALADRVSVKDRYLIQGYASYVLDESPLKAIESYMKLVDLYPLDDKALTGLGAIYRNLEEWDLAQAQFDRILALNPRDSLALENKIFIETSKGQYDRAMALNDEVLASPQAGQIFVRQRPLIQILQSRFDSAAAELDRILTDSPDDIEMLELKGNIAQLRGEGPSARELYERIRQSGESDPSVPDFRGRLWLARLSIQEGKFERAREGIIEGIKIAQTKNLFYDEIETGLQLACIELELGQFTQASERLRGVFGFAQDHFITKINKTVLHLWGLAALGAGNVNEAERIGEELRLSIERASFPRQMRRHDHLMGSIALAEGRTDQAVRLLEHAASLLHAQRDNGDEQAFFEDALARAYYQSGSWTKAEKAYRGIIDLTTGRLLWGDIYARSFYWLGKIAQKTRDVSAARAHFEDFLRLWQDADGGLPEVEDARKQLEALKQASTE